MISPNHTDNKTFLTKSLKSLDWIRAQPKKTHSFYENQNSKIAVFLEVLNSNHIQTSSEIERNIISNSEALNEPKDENKKVAPNNSNQHLHEQKEETQNKKSKSLNEKSGIFECSKGSEKLINAPKVKNQVLNSSAKKLITASFVVNLILFGIKVFASVWSNSLSVIASCVDSFLDLLSGSILIFIQFFAKKKSPYKYPQGKSRIEPIGVLLYSSVMIMTSIQLLKTGVEFLVLDFSDNPHKIFFDWVAIATFSLIIGSKVILCVICHIAAKKEASPSVKALAQDHMNDVFTNSFGLAAASIAFYFPNLIWMDSLGMILLALLIIYVWITTALDQVKSLLGQTAPEKFISKLIYLAATFNNKIILIDKALAYHFGTRYLCEVDIVLPPDFPLKDAHDIGEQLEIEIEKMSDVERAFVHLDFETSHKPEHKIFY